MTSLEYGRFCDEVVNQTGLLVATVEGADLSATVPTAPDWALSDLLRHVGGNLRSLETAVRTGEAVTDPERQIPGHGGPPGDDPAALFAWLSEAAGRLLGHPGGGRPRGRGAALDDPLAHRRLGPPGRPRHPRPPRRRRRHGRRRLHRRPGPGRRRPRRVPRAGQQPRGRRGRPGRGGRRPRSQRDHPPPRHRHRPRGPRRVAGRARLPHLHLAPRPREGDRGRPRPPGRRAPGRLPPALPRRRRDRVLGDRAVLDAWLERVALQ